MMKRPLASISLILTLILASSLVRAQDTIFIKYGEFRDYAVDTLLSNSPYDQPILHGSVRLPVTDGQMRATEYGIYFDHIEASDCREGEEAYTDSDAIDTLIMTDSVWIVRTRVHDNCCFSFLCDLEVTDDGSLNLITHSYGLEICACNCTYVISWYINLYKPYYGASPAELKEARSKIKNVTLNGERKGAWKIR